jgi:hypothetical protein
VARAALGRRESAPIDSSQNWCLASGDEPETWFSRKIFLLPKSRFGVRATRLRADFRTHAMAIAQRSSISRITKNTTLQPLFCNFRNWSRCLSPAFDENTRAFHCDFDRGVSRAHGWTRQYFLKREAVFFVVLVYSGCSASRFPSARSD